MHISKFSEVPERKLLVPYTHKRDYFNTLYGIKKTTLKIIRKIRQFAIVIEQLWHYTAEEATWENHI